MIKQHAKQRRAAAFPLLAGLDTSPAEAVKHFSARARTEAALRNSMRTDLNADRTRYQLVGRGRFTPAHLQALRSASSQDALRQAITAGRELNDAEAATAPPDIKAAAGSQKTRAREHREEGFLAFVVKTNNGKGRSGGRSGR